MFELHIKLHSQGIDASEFSGHQVALTFEQSVSFAAGDAVVKEKVLAQLSSTVDAQAEAVLVLPSTTKLGTEYTFLVSAPDGRRLKEQKQHLTHKTRRIRIEVTPARPSTKGNADKFQHVPSFIHGKAADKFARKKIAGKQVLLWGKQTENGKHSVVAISQTDANGNFSAKYPLGQFIQAYASVGGAEIVPIELTTEKTFPQRLLLVIDTSTFSGDPTLDGDSDCACNTPIPRFADGESLNDSPSTYTNDLGGHCAVLNKPNRTLEEFVFFTAVRTSEPAIKGLTIREDDEAAEIALAETIQDWLARNGFAGTKEPKASHRILAGNGTENGKTPSRIGLSQLQALIASHYEITEKDVNEASRKSDFGRLKELLRSLKKRQAARAPLNQANPLDWDDEPTFYQTSGVAHGHLLKFKQEWIADGYSLGDLLYSLPLAPAQRRQIAILDWERKEEGQREETQTANDRLTASLSRDRDIREIVTGTISEHLEGESSAFTRGVGLGGGIAAAVPTDGALIGISGGAATGSGSAGSTASLDGNREVTSSSLQSLRDKTIQSAASARSRRSTVVQTVKQGESVRAQTETIANYNHCHAITVEYFEVLRHFIVKQRLVGVQECLFVPLEMTPFDEDKALRWKQPLMRALKEQKLLNAFAALARIRRAEKSGDSDLATFAESPLGSLAGSIRLSIGIVRPADNEKGEFDASAWLGVESLTSTSGVDLFEQSVKGSDDKTKSFTQTLYKKLAAELVSKLRLVALTSRGTERVLPIKAELASTIEPGKPILVTLSEKKRLTRLRRVDILGLRLECELTYPLPPGSRLEVQSLRLRYSSLEHAGTLFDERVDNNNLLVSAISLATPLAHSEMRNRQQRDLELARMLIPHLNDNLEYYHRAIWTNMDQERRFMLLDGAIAPNSGGKSIASVVENRLIGIAGNCMIFPVVNTIKLDPTYKDASWKDLFASYQTDESISRISLPTRGVYAESVIGSCNSCEKKDETRFWRFEESPLPDEPTTIEPLNTNSRQAPQPDLTPAPLAAPIINMQNAPAAPAPTGVADVLTLLGNSNSFKDLSGLSANQENAAAAFADSLSAADTFAKTATKLAAQLSLSRNADKALEEVKRAQGKGLLKSDTASKMTEQILSGLSGAGTQKGEAELQDRIPPQDFVNLAANTGSAPGGSAVFEDKNAQQKLELIGPSATPAAATSGASLSGPAALPGTASTPAPGFSTSFELFDDSDDFFYFYNKANQKSGVITLQAIVKPPKAASDYRLDVFVSSIGLPSTARGAVSVLPLPAAPLTRKIQAKAPGDLNIECALVNITSGKKEAFIVRRVRVPRFVEISELGGSIDAFVSSLKLADTSHATFKKLFLEELFATVEHCISTIFAGPPEDRLINLRICSDIKGFAGAVSLPFHFSPTERASFVTKVVIGNKSGTGIMAQNLDDSASGPLTHNQRILIFPGDLAEITSVTAGVIDAESQKVAEAIFARPSFDADQERTSAQVLGRLTGEQIAHELIHSLLGYFEPTPGATPVRYSECPDDISNIGTTRTFARRVAPIVSFTIGPDFPNSFSLPLGPIIDINMAQDDSTPLGTKFSDKGSVQLLIVLDDGFYTL